MRLCNSPKRNGQAAVELILSIIMFVIQLLLISTLSVYLFLQHNLISAAREGARTGAVSQNFQNGDDAAGIQEVKDRITDFMQETSNQTLTTGTHGNATINVTPPQSFGSGGISGKRTVDVEITYKITNPLPVNGFIGGLTGKSYPELQTIPLSASASMRFEE